MRLFVFGQNVCKARGHKWKPVELRYKGGTATAQVGRDRRIETVTVTWVCDEVCSRCGAESWWPQ